MFQLTAEKLAGLRSHFAISNIGRGGRRYAPYVFTERNPIIAAMILGSTQERGGTVELTRLRAQRTFNLYI